MDKSIDQAERFLALRDHNESELRLKLSAKKFSESEIDNAISFLKKNRELDEERYVHSFVRSNNRKHPEGKFIVFQRLIQKGADKEISTQVLNSIYTEEYTVQMLQKAYEQICKKLSDNEIDIIIQKLVKLGFTLSQVRKFLSEV